MFILICFIGEELEIQQCQTVKDACIFSMWTSKDEKTQIHIKQTLKVYSLFFHWGYQTWKNERGKLSHVFASRGLTFSLRVSPFLCILEICALSSPPCGRGDRAKPVHTMSLLRFRRGWEAGFSWLGCQGNELSINTLGMFYRLPLQF